MKIGTIYSNLVGNQHPIKKGWRLRHDKTHEMAMEHLVFQKWDRLFLYLIRTSTHSTALMKIKETYKEKGRSLPQECGYVTGHESSSDLVLGNI